MITAISTIFGTVYALITMPAVDTVQPTDAEASDRTDDDHTLPIMDYG